MLGAGAGPLEGGIPGTPGFDVGPATGFPPGFDASPGPE